MFSTLSRREIIILAAFNLLSANGFCLVMSKILLFGKGLNKFYHQNKRPIMGICSFLPGCFDIFCICLFASFLHLFGKGLNKFYHQNKRPIMGICSFLPGCCIGVSRHFNSEGHIMAVGDAFVFPGFLTPVLTQLFFPKPSTTFLTCFCRGERRKYAGKTVFQRQQNDLYTLCLYITKVVCL